MDTSEKIISNRFVRKLVRKMYAFSSWYMRRRAITKAILFFTVFVLPILIYAYLSTQTAMINILNTPILQAPSINVNLTQVPCRSLFVGRVIVVDGPFSYSSCYIINNTHYLYQTGLHSGVFHVLLNESVGNTYVLTIVKEQEVFGVETRYITYMVITDEENKAIELLNSYR